MSDMTYESVQDGMKGRKGAKGNKRIINIALERTFLLPRFRSQQ